MLRNKNSLGPPPPTMTWGKASPVLIFSVLFDVLRFMCAQLWFFGPAMIALYCVGKVESVWVVGSLLKNACAVGATVAGVFGFPILEVVGLILAMAVGLIGWLTIGLIVLTTNSRIIQRNPMNTLWFVGSLLISEVPFVGALPALTVTMFRMYSVQIKKEQAALKEYQRLVEEELVEQRQARAAELMQARARTEAQAADDEQFEYEAAKDAQHEEDNENSESEEIPDDVRKRA